MEHDMYDDVPVDVYENELQNNLDEVSETSRPRPHDPSKTVRAQATEAWFAVAAAALNTGADARRAALLLNQLRGAEVLYLAIGKQSSEACESAVAIAGAVLGDMHSGEVWLDDLGLSATPRLSADVRNVLDRIADTRPAVHPESRLAGAVAEARKQLARDGALRMVAAIDGGEAPPVLAETYRSITPPSSLDDTVVADDVATVAQLFDADTESADSLTLSLGYPSLDVALSTRAEFPRGAVRSGQLVVLVAPSGSGKTSLLNISVPALVMDARRQGHLGPGLFVHVEDDTKDLFDAMGVAPGRRFSELAEHVAWEKTSSREDFVKAFYRLILNAKRRAAETGLPVRLFRPPWVLVDYYQALTGAGESEVVSTSVTADLLLNGIANCDPVACRNFSGVSFQEYTGEAWPEGLEGAGVAVIVTAQLLLKGNQKPYTPEKDDWRAYAMADALDQPAWEPQPGDYPLARLDDIRGATKIIQHATTIVGLHRPRPRNNPEVGVTADGWPTLADTRGYFTILKARYGQKMLVVPVEFNRQRNGGSKAQYIDAAAEAAIAREGSKMLFDAEIWKTSGDPIIPKREQRSAMRLVRYA